MPGGGLAEQADGLFHGGVHERQGVSAGEGEGPGDEQSAESRQAGPEREALEGAWALVRAFLYGARRGEVQ